MGHHMDGNQPTSSEAQTSSNGSRDRASPAGINDSGHEASKMLEAALQQMDGIISGESTFVDRVQPFEMFRNHSTDSTESWLYTC